MTREEIERFVRETLDTNIANAVDVIAARWTEDRADAWQEGVVAGQMSVWNNSAY